MYLTVADLAYSPNNEAALSNWVAADEQKQVRKVIGEQLLHEALVPFLLQYTPMLCVSDDDFQFDTRTSNRT